MPPYPNDADGDTLRRIERDGSDMNEPILIEFNIHAESRQIAQDLSERLSNIGYAVEIEEFEEDSDLDVVVKIFMIPDYSEIVSKQRKLSSIANASGGNLDGWGTMGNNY